MRHYKPEIGKRNRFAALSYCWGKPTPVATITIDGKPFGVAQNLYDFLQNRFLHNRGMFSHESEVLKDRDLWVDAICINQNDDAEKSEQVQRMWEIYSGADLVIAWLGKEQAYTKRAFLALNTRYIEKVSGKTLPEVMKRLVEDGTPDVVELSANRYFSRAWIVQEILC
ncbi:heterokaryon incompatibility, partial [Bimuria novae-zelandiae CBS 107.79]